MESKHLSIYLYVMNVITHRKLPSLYCSFTGIFFTSKSLMCLTLTFVPPVLTFKLAQDKAVL